MSDQMQFTASDPNDPASAVPAPPGAEQLNLSDMRSAATADVMKNRMIRSMQASDAQVNNIRSAMPLISQLEAEKGARETARAAAVQPVLDAETRAYENKQKIARLPGNMGALVGMFNSDYSEGRQDAIIAAGNNQLAKGQLVYDAQMGAITSRANALRDQLSFAQQALTDDAETTRNVIQTVDMLTKAQDHQKADNINMLKSMGSGALNKMLSARDYKAPNGVTYGADEVEAAREARQTYDLNTQKLAADVQETGAKATIESTKARTALITQAIGTLSSGEVTALNNGKDIGGDIKAMSNGNIQLAKGLAISGAEFNKVWSTQYLQDQEVQQKLKASAVSMDNMANTAAVNGSKASVLIGLQGGNPAIDPETGQVSDAGFGTAALALARVAGQSNSVVALNGKIRDAINKGGDIPADAVRLLTPNGAQYTKAQLDAHAPILKDAEESVLAGADDLLRPALQERINNSGFITSDLSAAKAMMATGGRMDGPVFTGFRAELQDTMAPIIKSLVDRFNQPARNGKAADPAKMMEAMMIPPSVNPGATALFGRVDDAYKSFGGVKQAIISNDTDYVARLGLAQIQKQLSDANPTGAKVLEGIIAPDGSWTPYAANVIRKNGIANALPALLVEQDVKSVAAGTDNPNSPMGKQLLLSLARNVASGKAGVPQGAGVDTTNAVINRWVYANKPQQIFYGQFNAAAGNYDKMFGTALGQASSAMNAQSSGMGIAHGVAIPPALTNQQALQRLEQRRAQLALPPVR